MFARRVGELHPYVPGEQPADREYIKLNANENPYPPPPAVAEAVAQAVTGSRHRLGLYPDPDCTELRAAIAALLNATGGVLCRTATAADGAGGTSAAGAYADTANGSTTANAYATSAPHSAGNSGADFSTAACTPAPQDALPFTVTPDMIFCGNGSDEVLSFVFYTFFDDDRPLVLPQFTYSFYPVYCGYYHIPMAPIPLRADWTLDTGAMLDAAHRTQSGIIFANPNAPTGLALSRAQVAAMLRSAPKDAVFIVDEAYCDFGGESCIPLLQEFRNLVVVRTFSKSLSFAGMRLGYAVAHPELIAAVFTVKNSFNHFPVDYLAQAAATASCMNAGYYAQTARAIVAERERLSHFLRERGWLVLDSATNFVFAQKPGLAGRAVYEAAKRAGILIRHFATPGIEDFVRITIGTAEQTAQLARCLGAL